MEEMNEQKLKQVVLAIFLIEIVAAFIPFILLSIFTTNNILANLSLLIPFSVVIYKLKNWGLV